eukprot:6203970-Pleurochrysis_carterae.AAC.1
MHSHATATGAASVSAMSILFQLLRVSRTIRSEHPDARCSHASEKARAPDGSGSMPSTMWRASTTASSVQNVLTASKKHLSAACRDGGIRSLCM